MIASSTGKLFKVGTHTINSLVTAQYSVVITTAKSLRRHLVTSSSKYQAFLPAQSLQTSDCLKANKRVSYCIVRSMASETVDASKLTRPDWAKDYDTPYFVVHEKTQDYELREYEETKWVLTDMVNDGMWEAKSEQSKPFFKLFKYITGNNTASQKIPMTVPVRMEHTAKKVDMAFMVPHHVKDATPEPTNKEVRVVTVPRQLVYVRTFNGYANGFFGNKNYWADELEKLRESLRRDSKRFEPEKFFTTAYDSPWKFYDRHNEVWVTKLEED